MQYSYSNSLISNTLRQEFDLVVQSIRTRQEFKGPQIDLEMTYLEAVRNYYAQIKDTPETLPLFSHDLLWSIKELNWDDLSFLQNTHFSPQTRETMLIILLEAVQLQENMFVSDTFKKPLQKLKDLLLKQEITVTQKEAQTQTSASYVPDPKRKMNQKI